MIQASEAQHILCAIVEFRKPIEFTHAEVNRCQVGVAQRSLATVSPGQ